MLSFLFFLFFIFIAIVFIGLSIAGSVVRWLFGGPRGDTRNGGSSGSSRSSSHTSYTSSQGNPSSSQRHRSTTTSSGTWQANRSTSQPRQKVFGDDEGEYTDFEEISD